VRSVFSFLSIFLCVAQYLFPAIKDHYKPIENKLGAHSFGVIDYVYLINLDHRVQKYEHFLNELLPYGICPFRFSAVNGWNLTHAALQEIGVVFNSSMRGGGMGSVYRWDDGEEFVSHELIGKPGTTYFCHCMPRGAIGCLMSHVSVLRDAYDSGYELIWIMEDDIEVLQDPSILLSYIDELDQFVGRANWDILYTDRDYRSKNGYVLSYGTDYRPDVDTRDQKKYTINKQVSPHLRRIGSRFGTHSMIWSRSGMKKYLDYIEAHGIFLPIDLDVHLAPDIKLYTVLQDVITNQFGSLSDIGRDWQ
jgi:GR25 family glycosyltransferase involved in LPS biosynthesis